MSAVLGEGTAWQAGYGIGVLASLGTLSLPGRADAEPRPTRRPAITDLAPIRHSGWHLRASVLGGRPRGPRIETLLLELEKLAIETAEEDAAPFVACLARHGLLNRFATPVEGGFYRYEADHHEIFETLVSIGGVDLSTARLFEGHLNALQLIALYGTRTQQERTLAVVCEGGLLGVWGADGREPARLEPVDTEHQVLRGAKRFASGVGLVSLALVPVTLDGGGLLLLLLDARDPARIDLDAWDHRGMRRSGSGRFDLDGMPVGPDERVGAVDDYRREPFFVGGIWRCAAAQLGAIEAIVSAMARELNASGRDAHPVQMSRIGTAILAARTARLWVEDAAERVETFDPAASDDARRATVALSAFSRLAVERAAMEVIDLAERALGLGSFARGHPVERATRDLAVYIRQANPDAVLHEHGRVLAEALRA